MRLCRQDGRDSCIEIAFAGSVESDSVEGWQERSTFMPDID